MQPATLAPPPRAPAEAGDAPHGAGREDLGAALAWAGLVTLALAVGTLVVARSSGPGLQAAPLDGRWDWRPGVALLPAVGLGAVTVLAAPRLAARAPWRVLVPAAGTVTATWTVALAAADGWSRVAAPLATEHEYLGVVDRIGSPHEFLATYTERLSQYPVHVKGHPPGMPLVLWGLDRVGLGGAGWATVLVLAGAALATGSVLVAVRGTAGEPAARRAAPFLAVAPAALWLGTSADALFAGTVALGCTLLVVGRRWTSLGAGGLLLGAALHLTYGAVPLLAIPLAVAWRRRDARPVLGLAVGVLVVTVGFAAAGFWWFDGLAATRHFYHAGVAGDRAYALFTPLINPGALALAAGPAAAAGLWTARRDATLALLPYAALGAVMLANISGLSKGEVERIWLPFVGWLLAATAALPAVRARAWLAVQVALALVLQAALRSPW